MNRIAAVRLLTPSLRHTELRRDARYDVSYRFECVHDFRRPVEVLRHARAVTKPDGTVIVMDENAAETLLTLGDPVQRFFGAPSALWCLPQGPVGPDPEPVGTFMRP